MSHGAPPDTCPRCGDGFACAVAGPGPCPCTTLTLSAELQATLRARYTGCLCMKCLGELASGADVEPGEASTEAGSKASTEVSTLASGAAVDDAVPAEHLEPAAGQTRHARCL